MTGFQASSAVLDGLAESAFPSLNTLRPHLVTRGRRRRSAGRRYRRGIHGPLCPNVDVCSPLYAGPQFG